MVCVPGSQTRRIQGCGRRNRSGNIQGSGRVCGSGVEPGTSKDADESEGLGLGISEGAFVGVEQGCIAT